MFPNYFININPAYVTSTRRDYKGVSGNLRRKHAGMCAILHTTSSMA